MLVMRSVGRSTREASARSLSPSMLFMCTPVSPANQPEPQPVEQVIEAAPPSASITLIWDVPRAEGGSPPGKLGDSAAAAIRSAASTSERAPPR